MGVMCGLDGTPMSCSKRREVFYGRFSCGGALYDPETKRGTNAEVIGDYAVALNWARHNGGEELIREIAREILEERKKKGKKV